MLVCHGRFGRASHRNARNFSPNRTSPKADKPSIAQGPRTPSCVPTGATHTRRSDLVITDTVFTVPDVPTCEFLLRLLVTHSPRSPGLSSPAASSQSAAFPPPPPTPPPSLP